MNCWVVCLPRTGSTFFCDLLNQTGAFPEYNDNRLKDTIGPIQKGRAFNEWLRIFSNYHDLSKNPPSCCKAIYHQYVEVMGEIPINKRRKPDNNYQPIDPHKENFVRAKFKLNAVQSLFTKIKFLNLKRNIYEQTVSTYFARQTQKYHIYNEKDAKNYFKKSIKVNDKKLVELYKEINAVHNAWEGMFCRNNQYYTIYYDELIKEPEKTLIDVMDFLKIDFNEAQARKVVESVSNEKRTYKMTRPEFYKIVDHLKNLLEVKISLFVDNKIFL